MITTAPELIVDIPLNTMLADLDEAVGALLRRELRRHGFDEAAVVFDAPGKDLATTLTHPTVDLFLYDLRESVARRALSRHQQSDGNGRIRVSRPPMIIEATYAITAWSQNVDDEHRLLSQVLQILFGYPILPASVLPEGLARVASRHVVETEIAQPRGEGKADFWTAVGGQFKPSIDYVVYVACECPAGVLRSPEVRTQTIRVDQLEGVAGHVVEHHRHGGRIVRPDRTPVPEAWVSLPEAGLRATTDAQGRFRLDGVPGGTHRLVARTPAGELITETITVPGSHSDLVVTPEEAPA